MSSRHPFRNIHTHQPCHFILHCFSQSYSHKITMQIHAYDCVFCFDQYSVSHTSDVVQPEAQPYTQPTLHFTHSNFSSFFIFYQMHKTVNVFSIHAQCLLCHVTYKITWQVEWFGIIAGYLICMYVNQLQFNLNPEDGERCSSSMSLTLTLSKTTNYSEQSIEPGKQLYINVNFINQQKERHPGAYRYQLIHQLTWSHERETSKQV
jgi:hypothetical protein